MLATELGYVLSTGERGSLRSLYKDKPLVLVFLRHLGCLFCREHVAALREQRDWNVAFVTMASVEETAKFREQMASPHLFIADSTQDLYHAFGLGRGNFGQMFNLHTLRRGLEATRAGHKSSRPVGDPWVLGGTFIIGTDGELAWSQLSHDASDNATVVQIAEHLALAH
ncbi:MAG: SelL-related redox protein [Fimbriimonas sp.]